MTSKYTKELLAPIVARNTSVRGVLIELGLSSKAGSGYVWMKRRIVEIGLDTSHFFGRRSNRGSDKRADQENSTLKKFFSKIELGGGRKSPS